MQRDESRVSSHPYFIGIFFGCWIRVFSSVSSGIRIQKPPVVPWQFARPTATKSQFDKADAISIASSLHIGCLVWHFLAKFRENEFSGIFEMFLFLNDFYIEACLEGAPPKKKQPLTTSVFLSSVVCSSLHSHLNLQHHLAHLAVFWCWKAPCQKD